MNLVTSSFMIGPQRRPRERSRGQRAVFFDTAGGLLEDMAGSVDPERMCLSYAAREALKVLGKLGYRLIVISNEYGIGNGGGLGSSKSAASAQRAIEACLAEMFEECGATLSGFFWCPHARHASPQVSCFCRKPMPGLLHRAAARVGVHMAESWMVGDILDDVEAGRRAGCRTILIANGTETVWQLGPYRSPHYLVHGLDDAARVIAESRRTTQFLHEPEPARA